MTVGADGSIAANTPTVAALNALRSVQTFEDKKRGTADAMAYAASLGVTSNFDMGGFLIPGSPDHEDEFTFDGAASWDPYTAYDAMLELHRAGADAGPRAHLLPQHGQLGRDPDPLAPGPERLPRVRQRLAEDRRPRRVHHQLAAVRAGRAAVELSGRRPQGGRARLDLLSSTRCRRPRTTSRSAPGRRSTRRCRSRRCTGRSPTR